MQFKTTILFTINFIILISASATWALDPQPRQWSHLPNGSHFIGAGYAYTTADIAFNPALDLLDVSMKVDTLAVKYIYAFDLLGQSARFDVGLPYQHGHWQGLVAGEQKAISRNGMADSTLRLSVNLFGSPVLSGKDYLQYRRSTPSETIVGAALAVRLPTGQYDDNKLINLGKNRFALRPQLGVVHTQGPWTLELTSELGIFSDNNDFYQQQKLAEKPLLFIHGHASYSFSPGLWVGMSAGFDNGGETRINDVISIENKKNTGWAFNAAYPLSKTTGLRLNYIGTHTQETKGLDSSTYTLSLSHML